MDGNDWTKFDEIIQNAKLSELKELKERIEREIELSETCIKEGQEKDE